jgi:hypothetical protein
MELPQARVEKALAAAEKGFCPSQVSTRLTGIDGC